uniref:Uncharacterized protein n=1 Tax=Schlesneria paludicola TaxID=360056 RepID=A0A7C4LKY7_9PLAN
MSRLGGGVAIRVAHLTCGLALFGCQLMGCQPVATPPPPAPAPPPRVVQRPVEPPPVVPEAVPEPPPPPAPPPAAPPSPPRMAPPTIRWHERLAEEVIHRRQRGMHFRVIYFQAPLEVTTRVAIKDKYGNELFFAARRLEALGSFAGIDEFVPNATHQGGPYAIKVEYHDPDEKSWSDAVSYEFLPKP